MTLKVNRYIEWRNLKQEQIRLQSEVLPRLQLLDLKESINGARSQIQGARRQLREKKTEQADLIAKIKCLEQSLAAARQREVASGVNLKFSGEISQVARDAVTQTTALLSERARLAVLSQSRYGEDVVVMAEAVGRERQRLAAVQNERAEIHRRMDAMTALTAALNSGRPAAPEDVREFCAALTDAKISHRMLIEIVEVTDPAWQVAVEALLAPYRQLVLLNHENDRAKAWHIGEQLRYCRKGGSGLAAKWCAAGSGTL